VERFRSDLHHIGALSMKRVSHTSAQPSHYDKEAEQYDAFNEERSKVINHSIERILKQHKVKTVLDLACGTGSQVFWLSKNGYDVVGYDINEKMLEIAKTKAKKESLDIRFLKGDMRSTNAGKFDAVITIFNAIGHLTKEDFEQAIKNIHANLKDGGLYIFDIFNLNYLLTGDNITKLTIDWLKKKDNTVAREIQYSTINQEGVLASYDIYIEQKNGSKEPKISEAFQTLQVYSAQQLKDLFENNGFEVVVQCDIDGSGFDETKTERIMTIAQKKH